MSEETRTIISSPCIGVCKMQNAGAVDLCGGCLRTRDEIARWRNGMSEDERLEIMFVLPEREKLLQPMQSNGCG